MIALDIFCRAGDKQQYLACQMIHVLKRDQIENSVLTSEISGMQALPA